MGFMITKVLCFPLRWDRGVYGSPDWSQYVNSVWGDRYDSRQCHHACPQRTGKEASGSFATRAWWCHRFESHWRIWQSFGFHGWRWRVKRWHPVIHIVTGHMSFDQSIYNQWWNAENAEHRWRHLHVYDGIQVFRVPDFTCIVLNDFAYLYAIETGWE